MIDIALIKKAGCLYPADQESKEKLNNYLDNQPLRAKISGYRKPRSYQQLKLYFACCRAVAENARDDNLNTQVKVDEYCRIKAGFVESYMVIDGQIHIKTKSVAYKNLKHIEACNYFSQAFEIMAKILGITKDELLENCVENI